jgi:hypothetical protein
MVKTREISEIEEREERPSFHPARMPIPASLDPTQDVARGEVCADMQAIGMKMEV